MDPSNPTTATAKDRAYRTLKERILDGQLSGGTLLGEAEVAAELGMSRTPVRDAFIRLAGEELLRIYPKRGAIVVPVSAEEIDAVMETRLAVEAFALEQLVARGIDVTPELRAALELQERLVAAGDVSAFVDADRELHRLIVERGSNRILLSLYDSLRDRQRRLGASMMRRDRGHLAASLEEHGRLVEAIGSGDGPAARAALAEHLAATRGRLLDG
jgi:DNA-binding GntR family transcriptional regulator